MRIGRPPDEAECPRAVCRWMAYSVALSLRERGPPLAEREGYTRRGPPLAEREGYPKENRSRCRSKNVSTGNLQLPLARFLSWATRRILRLRMRCGACGAFFWHLHALPRTVIGYHGCNRT